MRVIVTSTSRINSLTLVWFQCRAGQGVGIWSKGADPKTTFSYDVELDVDKTITDLFVEKLSELPAQSLKLSGDNLFITGLVEDVDEDGMAYFRLAPDCLLMIESGNTVFSSGDVIVLKVSSQDLLITAQGM